MTRLLTTTLALMFTASIASAHCQVPCGIYGDQMRFEQMLEDTQTISKAQSQVGEIAKGNLQEAQAINQAARWVTTKEEHATKIQSTIAAYFMAQRIKADGDNYTKKLTAAHAVMVGAMKCKQSADPATAKALEKAIFDFYRVYEGKEPDFAHSH
ncbi:superoxide dismutase [Ni] [Roseiconus lacunae]|uniref:superoxide dismutase [Ni] n=1 Tax=Roseiconus lacunae TaxID=2605694 RepID=UPI0011F35F32|nr:superoxide dismutase [Ni] [Roseiconus lacunae]